MRKAVFVYQATPMFGFTQLPNGDITGLNRHQKFVKKMNEKLEVEEGQWIITVDDTHSDIEQIQKKNVDAIICVPGLQKQFHVEAFPKERIFYLDSLDYYNYDTSKPISFLHSIQNKLHSVIND